MLSKASFNLKCLKRKSRSTTELLMAWDQVLLEIFPEYSTQCGRIEPERGLLKPFYVHKEIAHL
jgi:hypothetical protein